MRVLYRLFILALFVLAVTTGFAQQQPLSKTLLWRISGKGLQKPSYLFGTMHLTDKRLFNFTDSTYKAIENTEGLAIEVNPDELMAYMVNKMFDEINNSKTLKELLSDKDYKKYAPSLAKKLKKPADEITSRDVVKEKNRWMTDYLEKGEMPTFVDAYLYNTAKKQGKWIGGIEDVSDQANLINSMFDESDLKYMVADDKTTGGGNGLEKLISIYTSQDIEAIEDFTNATTSAGKKDTLLTIRNIKMARRIDSLAAFRTMFFAIGAAHLPGDSGVIRLLRDRGFTVEPVLSTKKIAAADYKFKEVDVPWVPVTDVQNTYTVAMPGKPVDIKMFGLVDMKFLFDLGNLSGYYTAAIASARKFTDNDSMYNGFIGRMFKGRKNTGFKKIEASGVEGREYAGETDKMNMRIRIFIKDKIVYLAMAYAYKKENVNSAGVEKFFNSFTINKTQVADGKKVVFTDSVMGISFISPVPLTPATALSKKNENGWNITTYTGADLTTGAYVMLFSKEVVAGSTIPNDSGVYKQYNKLQKTYTGIQTTDTIVKGITFYITQAVSEAEKVHMKIYNTVIGNRNISLMLLADSQHINSPAMADVFNSLTILPQPAGIWKQYTNNSAGYSTWAPSAFRPYNTAGSSYTIAFDTATATTYYITADTLGKYDWVENDSSFWAAKVAAYTQQDTALSQTSINLQGLTGRELLTKPGGSINACTRTRMLLNGNLVYKLSIAGEKRTLYSDNANKFFSSFTLLNPVAENSLTSSKAGLLLQDLQSTDSATQQEALDALYKAPFTAADLPKLHEALFKTYPIADDYYRQDYINSRVGNNISKLANASSVAYIKSQYNNLTGDREALKNTALEVLAGIKTKESYNTLAELLTKWPPKTSLSYNCVEDLQDSLLLTNSIFSSLLPLANDTTFTLDIAEITNTLLDSNLVQVNNLAAEQPNFINKSGQLLPAIKLKATVNYRVYNLAALLGKFKTAEAYAMLKSYLDLQDGWLKITIVDTLLSQGQNVAPQVLTGLAADKSTRVSFYDILKKGNRLQLFPATYLTQPYFAEGAVYSVLTGDDDDDEINPADTYIDFLTKKTAKYKDTTYTFYLYKVYFGDDKSSIHLGIAGGYKAGSKELLPDKDLSGVYWDEKYDPKKQAEYLAAYLKQLESYSKENSGEEEE